jgi:hypothetical protein
MVFGARKLERLAECSRGVIAVGHAGCSRAALLAAAAQKQQTREASMSDGSVPNPFDPASLRLDQNFAETVGVKKLLMTVPVRKPNRQDFVRVHPDPLYRLTPAAIIELREDREIYLVTPNIAGELPSEFSPADVVHDDK